VEKPLISTVEPQSDRTGTLENRGFVAVVSDAEGGTLSLVIAFSAYLTID